MHRREHSLAKSVCGRAQGANDCGVVCLAFIAGLLGRRVSLAALRLACGTSPAGTTALGLLDGGKLLGLGGKGFRLETGEVKQLPLPAIAHVRTSADVPHYVVLCGLHGSSDLRVMDPERGAVELWPGKLFAERFLGTALVFAPTPGEAPIDVKYRGVSSWARLCQILLPYRGFLLQSFLGALAMTILGLATAVFVQLLVDQVLPQGDRRLLALLGCGMAGVIIARGAIGWFQGRLALRLAEEVDARLVTGYYRHLMRLPQTFFQSMRTGEMIARLGDAILVREFLAHTLVALLINPLIILFSLAVLFLYSWKLGALALGLLPAFTLLQWMNHWLQGRHQRNLMQRGADLEAQMVTSLHCRTLIRENGIDADTTLDHENNFVRLLRTAWKAGTCQLGVGTSGLLLTQGFLLALLWWGGLLALRGEITPGELMSAFTLAGYLAGPMAALLGLGVHVQEALIGTERLYEVLDLEVEQDTGEATLSREQASRGIRFESVTVRPPGSAAILRQVSCAIPPGKITALSGPTGSGKSTLLALLQRLHEPSDGRILIGDVDLRIFTRRSLRDAIAVVSQKVELQRGTILSNLTPGLAAPDIERLLDLCRLAGFMDFIDQQPQGLLTPLMEGAPNISGGQRQKLAIIRALYRDMPILLLDEPSSALDRESEEALIRLLRDLSAEGRTIIVAAHSDRLLEAGDQILRFDQGGLCAVESNYRSAAMSQT